MSSFSQGVYGYLAEFRSASALYQAAKKVCKAGFLKWDCYSPYPIHGLDKAMSLGRSRLPWFVLCGGICGFVVAFLLTYGTQVILYPTVVQGKPANIFTLPAFFPVLFELTVLFSGITTLFGFLFLSKLPMLHHPLFNSMHFKKVTDAGFFICIEAKDSNFCSEKTKSFLKEIGGEHIELVNFDTDLD